MTDAPDWPDASDKAAFWTCAWIVSMPQNDNRRLNPMAFRGGIRRPRTPKGSNCSIRSIRNIRLIRPFNVVLDASQAARRRTSTAIKCCP